MFHGARAAPASKLAASFLLWNNACITLYARLTQKLLFAIDPQTIQHKLRIVLRVRGAQINVR